MPAAFIAWIASGIFAIADTSAAIFCTISGGVPTGASTPTIGAKSNPGISSAIAGRSGACAERCSELVASIRTRPSFTNPESDGYADISTSTCPPTSAGTDCPVPLNGTWTMSSPSPAFIASIVRWCVLPMPDEP